VAVPVLEEEIPAPAVAAKQGFLSECNQLRPLVGEQVGAWRSDEGLPVGADHSAHGTVGGQNQVPACIYQQRSLWQMVNPVAGDFRANDGFGVHGDFLSQFPKEETNPVPTTKNRSPGYEKS